MYVTSSSVDLIAWVRLCARRRIQADEHFCRVEDTECNFFVPDTVDLVHCTAANDYCKVSPLDACALQCIAVHCCALLIVALLHAQAAEEAKSHVSSCPKCELKRLKCHENCKRQVIIFCKRARNSCTFCVGAGESAVPDFVQCY